LLVVLLGTGNAAMASLPLPKDANVLLITIDTLRYDRVGILSDRYVKTPNLDSLARRSAVFTRAYAHNPLTRPSHANIMTGTTALYHGVSDNPSFRLEDRYLTLAEHLKENSYKNGAFIGAFVLDSRFGLNRGFDLYNDYTGVQEFGKFDFVERPADQVVKPAIEWIAVGSMSLILMIPIRRQNPSRRNILRILIQGKSPSSTPSLESSSTFSKKIVCLKRQS
jgi:hypothetical protein